MQFNNEEFKRFRVAMKKALAEVEKEFGVEVEVGNIKYSESSFTITTNVLNGGKEEALKKEFENLCTLYGLKKDDYGKTFLYNNVKTTIIGIESNRRKYPIVVKDENGKEFLMTTSGVKEALNKATV